MEGFRSLEDQLLDRLGSSHLNSAAQDAVLAAYQGDAELAGVIDGQSVAGEQVETEPAKGGPRGSAYLSTVSVQGFRGIGAESRLALQPGPGLTLIVGRNGSGKSSFAEAVEVSLTGTSYRWKSKSSVWRTGWRNVHTTDEPLVAVDLLVDGSRGVTTVSRHWTGGQVEDTDGYVQRHGEPRAGLDTLCWEDQLLRYRPFLSYAELGQMLTGHPKDAYEALAAILGLDPLTDAERRLRETRKRLTDEVRDVRAESKALRTELTALDDPRAAKVDEELAKTRPDLIAIRTFVLGESVQSASHEIIRLRRIHHLEGPDVRAITEAVAALRLAAEEVAALRGTDADDSERVADLLSRALDHYDSHPGNAVCPVCGTADVIDAAWAELASEQVGRLHHELTDLRAAQNRLAEAVNLGRALIPAVPPDLPESLLRVWESWYSGREIVDAAALAEHLESRSPTVTRALSVAQSSARERLDELEDRWRPVAVKASAWLAAAEQAETHAPALATVKAGYDWLCDVANDLRNSALRPIAEKAAGVWAELRQESNVQLGPITLAGSATRRHVELDVAVDGVESKALGVMSQGELHSLALALFLPRATSDDSPFRFLVIDDPVQSMDPAKVDGLARVLSGVAGSRQVVVFTHDPRLVEATRHLELPATILEVTRGERSVVEIRLLTDPVSRLLQDAHALVRTENLPEEAARRAVPALCRTAMEAVLVGRIRRQLLAAGRRHTEIEDEIGRAVGAYDLASLAYFGDRSNGGKVLQRINKYGGWAGNTFKACKDGGHAPYDGRLDDLVRDARKLAGVINADR